MRAILRKAGRKRGIDAEAEHLAAILRQDAWLRQPALIERAMGHRALALLRQLDAACAGEHDLAQAAEEAFEQHPDVEILTSFPGAANSPAPASSARSATTATRFADARALKAYAGSAPITRASGKSLAVMTRRVKNQRLAAAGYVWAFSALAHDPGAHYDRRRAAGEPLRRRATSLVQPHGRHAASQRFPTEFAQLTARAGVGYEAR